MYLNVRSSDSAAVVDFTGKVQRIARVHQLGLKDRPSRNSEEVAYPARQLIGFSVEDREIIETVILKELG